LEPVRNNWKFSDGGGGIERDDLGAFEMLLGTGSLRVEKDPLLKAALKADSASSEGAKEEDIDCDGDGDRGDDCDGDDGTCGMSSEPSPIRACCCK
jgi:hypothetical protein